MHYVKTNLSYSLVNLQSCFNVAEKTSCGSRFDANELGKLACWVPQETLEPQFLKLDNDFSDQKSGVHFLPQTWQHSVHIASHAKLSRFSFCLLLNSIKEANLIRSILIVHSLPLFLLLRQSDWSPNGWTEEMPTLKIARPKFIQSDRGGSQSAETDIARATCDSDIYWATGWS